MLRPDQSVLQQFPPMGIYEVLFGFEAATGSYLGNPGTHPWAQGFPLTTQIPGGPELPGSVEFGAADLKYPPATGTPQLLEAIRDYYNHFYGSDITTDNIAIFAGGRPAIYATLSFLNPENRVLIEETEYTPYYDVLKLLGRDHALVPSNESNNFRPTIDDYQDLADRSSNASFVIKSNPCNPTGVTWTGNQLKSLVEFCSKENQGGIIDEAYEFFHTPEAVSSMKYVKDIDDTNLFVIGAATKGLQVPGMRTGWMIASKKNIEIFRNYSSLAMGGVARPTQLYVADLMKLERVTQARGAIANFYGEQRQRYQKAFEDLGIKLFTGKGGFYHWGKLPGNLTAAEFNQRLYEHKAAILPGTLCDMHRRGNDGPHAQMMRFSFGPLEAENFEANMAIFKRCLST
ncbi:MAG: pyridoxal phosphate-dependent aminotransferase [Halopseudomonas aestusnigri]